MVYQCFGMMNLIMKKMYRAILEKKEEKYYLEIQEYKKKYFWSKRDWTFHESHSSKIKDVVMNHANKYLDKIPNINDTIKIWCN
jgi:hypothetical protein